MKNYVSSGESLSVRATSEVKSGDFVVLGEAFGFAVSDAAVDDLFALSRKGEFRVDFPALTAAFAPVFVDEIGELTLVADGNKRVGMTGAEGTSVILQEAFGAAEV